MKENVKLFIKSYFRFIPEILLLGIAIISGLYCHVIYDFSSVLYSGLFFVLFMLSILNIYLKLYSWRNLEVSTSSFIFFTLNVLQLCLYLFSISIFIRMLFRETSPIYLKDLSIISQYRYLFLFLITIFFILLWGITKFLGFDVSSYISYISFPYLKEEFRLVLDSWGDGKMGISFINHLSNCKYYRYIYLSMDWLYVLIRLLIALLLFSFSFFSCNLYYLLYFSPLMFLFWLLSFFTYFIEWIIEGNFTVFREWLEISTASASVSKEYEIESLSSSNVVLYFKLTKDGYKQGFNESNIPDLTKRWLILADLTAFLSYRRYIKYISLGISMIIFISWFYISYYCFFSGYSEITTAGGLNGLVAAFRSSPIWKPSIGRMLPRDMRFGRECYQNAIKTASNNEFAVGHPVYGELLPDGTYRIDGFLTRNPNFGTKIANNPIVVGKAGTNQNAVPFSKPLIVPANYVTPSVQGSTAVLESLGVKAIFDHIQNN